MMTTLITILVVAELVYMAIALYMYLVQRRLLFLPQKDMQHPKDYGMTQTEELVLTADDGVEFVCWYQPPVDSKGYMLFYFHGNAIHIGDEGRVEKFKAFLHDGMGICIPSYRGYGKSKGHATEEGIYKDARAVIKFLQQKGYPMERIILYGESLGTGVAVQMATEFPNLRALVLEAPYTSVADRGQERYPFLPVYVLIKDQFDSLSKIPKVKPPLLLLHGDKDQTIPVHHGHQLLQAATTKKIGVFFSEVEHVNFPSAVVSRMTRLFAEARTIGVPEDYNASITVEI